MEKKTAITIMLVTYSHSLKHSTLAIKSQGVCFMSIFLLISHIFNRIIHPFDFKLLNMLRAYNIQFLNQQLFLVNEVWMTTHEE